MQGDFDKGSKTTAKNVEVTVSVYDEDGKRLEVRAVAGARPLVQRVGFPWAPAAGLSPEVPALLEARIPS